MQKFAVIHIFIYILCAKKCCCIFYERKNIEYVSILLRVGKMISWQAHPICISLHESMDQTELRLLAIERAMKYLYAICMDMIYD